MANENKKPKVVQSPVTNEYLTKGKSYDVVGINGQYDKRYGYHLAIVDDIDNEIFTNQRESTHTDGLDWIVVEYEN